MLLSLLGLLLFLAAPALATTKGGPVDVRFIHVKPTEPFFVEEIVGVGGKTYALTLIDGYLVQLPDNAVNYHTQKITQQRVKYPVDVLVIGQIWKVNGSWTARANGKTYHGLKSHAEATAKVFTKAKAQIMPDTGGIAPGIIVLACIALLIGVSLLIWRIVSR